MAGMGVEEAVATIGRARAAAIVRAPEAGVAGPALDAAVRGGFRVVEATLTTPDALDVVRLLSRDRRLLVGAGTVLSVDDVRAAVDAGARYLVSPVVDEAVVEEAARLGVAAMPGAATPTEMWRAHRAGAPLVKLFPAPAGGPAWLAAVRGPLPFLRIVPTNGVDAANAGAWLAAGAFAVGFAAVLFPAADLAARAFDRIEARARDLVAACAAREGG